MPTRFLILIGALAAILGGCAGDMLAPQTDPSQYEVTTFIAG